MKLYVQLALTIFCAQMPYLMYSKSVTDEQWQSMQQEYQRLTSAFNGAYLVELEQAYCHPFWVGLKAQLQQLISGPRNKHFVSNSPLTGNMVRDGWGVTQQYEAYFLQNCLSEASRTLINNSKDTSLGTTLPRHCKEFNCSTNTLGHLYYAGRSIEQFHHKNIKTITEFGGGYGNLARIFKEMLPDSTYFIVDLPELLAIQFLFLKAALPNTTVQIHTEIPQEFTKGTIHLVPIYVAKDLNISTDLFISTFAISEASELSQTTICEKNFFNASVCYIVGTFPGTDFPWVHHSVLQSALRSAYKVVELQPFYLYFHPGNIKAYEAIGLNFNS